MRTPRAVFISLLVLLTAIILPARAQEDPSGTSYITPFPESDTYKLQAYGDGFAEGMLGGLVEAFAGDGRVQVSRKYRGLAGITRADFDDEMKTEEASRETFHIGVVMIGIADRASIRVQAGKRVALGSEEWRAEYGRRVDRFIKILKRRGTAIYWVGLPILRRSDANDDAQVINDIVRDKAYLNGIRYVDIQAQFADEAGNYAAYGPDLTGKSRLLREADGVQFTQAGNRKLAHFVEQEIRRDLTQARSERSIPLAGAETEQKRISAAKPRPAEVEGGWKSAIANLKDGTSAQPKSGAAAPAQAPTADNAGEKAENGRITIKSMGANGREESATIDIPRPAIPAAVITLMTRKQSADRPSQVGDVIAEDLGGGLVVLNSITPSTTGQGVKRAAPSQAAYYQVLIKGERLQPKPGRADDFTWPRVDPEIAADPVQPSRPPPRPSSQKITPRS